MSSNTAINIFANAVVMTRSIPFEIKAPKVEPIDGLAAFYALRDEARKNGIQDMTLEEINQEINKARAERKNGNP
jgi:DNA-damage-inducible protein J